jgi:hypothetical protein
MFPKLFPTSPLDRTATGTSSPQKEPPTSIGDIQDTSNVSSSRRANSPNPSSVDGIVSSDLADSDSYEDTDTKEVEESGETMEDVNVILEKVRHYALHIFKHARTADGGHGVRKYSRKLRRLTKAFANA